MLEKLLSGNMVKLNLAELIVLILNFPDEINTLMIQKTFDGYCVIVDDISVLKEANKRLQQKIDDIQQAEIVSQDLASIKAEKYKIT